MSERPKRGLLARLFGRAKPAEPHEPTQVEQLREEVAREIEAEEDARQAVAAAEAEAAARKAAEAEDARAEDDDRVDSAKIAASATLQEIDTATDTGGDPSERANAAVETDTPDVAAMPSTDAVSGPRETSEDVGVRPVSTPPSAPGTEATGAPPPKALPRSEPASRRSAAPVASAPKGFFARLTQGLTKTSGALNLGIADVFTKRKLDAATLEELEDILIQADLGVETATRVTQAVGEGRYGREIAPDEVREILAHEVASVLDPVARAMPLDPSLKPQIVLVVGVNGSGKTTTIGKLASKFSARGRTVMLAAGDTFRAAAVEQLKVWGERTGAPVVTRPHGADAASLAFDAIGQARAAGTDVLMIDTAGRLQNKAELMAELEKVVRVVKKIDPKAPHTVLLVLDATVGQNAMNQVEVFKKTAGVTGLAMTKLDGTAKGGILVAIAAKHKLPIHFIGVGEGIDDLEPFDPEEFAAAIVGAE